MRALGILILVCGLLWATFGAALSCSDYSKALKATARNDEAGANRAMAEWSGTFLFSAALFMLPGLMLAGVGALVTKKSRAK